MLLDEPTAGLDSATEADVLAVIDELALDAAVILVSHRPQAIDTADSVVEVHAERIPEQAVTV